MTEDDLYCLPQALTRIIQWGCFPTTQILAHKDEDAPEKNSNGNHSEAVPDPYLKLRQPEKYCAGWLKNDLRFRQIIIHRLVSRLQLTGFDAVA